ncbi:ubiquitin carboxyl-terminal hydrolase 34 isoform X2 [Nematostella vectensis]|uniref:ubiquitin carboxyl-terminal hydrolase 34 isoform X2 n=1 Tax=Nematostella vectensis TaxID=45351 RepID=UPI0020777027|nr:ubiquitin carboxyl-terminal hydrolase 34 isoform X2 [Nematostella vectensis]
MSECCKDLFTTLDKYDLDEPQFTKEDVLTVVAFILSWQHRQCRCVFRDQLNLSRLEDQFQILLSCAIEEISPAVNKHNVADATEDEPWNDIEREKLFVCVGKVFQLHFPFYQARQIPLVRQDITAKDCNKYCDMNDGEVPEALLINIAYFCEKGGLSAIRTAFQDKGPDTLSLAEAHLLVSMVTQLRVWFSVQAIVQYITPLRGPVIRYLCKLSDKDLRQPDGRTTMADTMWSAVKGPVESGPIFDRDSMDLAFKYFTSSTLTIRLAGLNQIANQVHMFMDLFQANTVGEIDSMCAELSQWLLDNNIVEHLFGPNLHVELLKQSQIILNYLAQEGCVSNQHLDCIWAAAQLKHASRYVHDLLTVLTKHLDMPSILYLLDQVSAMQPSAHTKQTLFLASILLRIIWSAGLSTAGKSVGPAHVTSPVHGPLPAGAASAAVTAALQRKFRRGDSMSQSSSRSGSISDISFDADHRDMEESPKSRKFTNLPPDNLDLVGSNTPPTLPPGYDSPADEFPNSNKAEDADIDSTSCTNSHGSSLSGRRGLEDFEGDDIEDELTQLKAVVALRSIQKGDSPKSFDLSSVCDEGKTLLWDLLQDKNAIHLEDGLIQETEKLLCQLICYTGEKKIRMKFVEGCLDNLSNNRSTVMSIQLLPKLLSSFQQYINNSYGPHWVTKFATTELGMMDLFFKNLVLYMEGAQGQNKPVCSLYTHMEEVQARLHFLSSIYSSELSPPDFSLSVDQVDALWSTLIGDPQCCDEALEWFVQQVQSKELHALDRSVLKYIFTTKLPSLTPESFSMTGLTLLQQLYKMFKHSSIKSDDAHKVYGIDQVWNIAIQAKSTEVSMSAMKYLNSLYINADGGSLQYEDEFISRCIDSIKAAASSLSQENQDDNLQIMERGICLLKTHIETFKRRFAFHLRLWLLEGQGITCHKQKQQRPSEKHFPIRVMCQPAGLSDKGTFEMHSSDLVAELRAEVTHWCKLLQERIQQEHQSGDGMQHAPLSPFSPQLHPPFRLISQGHELTPDLDEKSLADVGFKDLQLVFVSVGAARRDRYHDGSQVPSSVLPAPSWDNTPMVILLREQHSETLFSFLEILDDFNSSTIAKPMDDSSAVEQMEYQPLASTSDFRSELRAKDSDLTEQKVKTFQESHAEFLCQLIWELLCILPTNHTVLNRLKFFGHTLASENAPNKVDSSKPEGEHSYEGFSVPWESILDPKHPHKLLYSLQVIHFIHRAEDDTQNTSANESSSSSEDSDSSEETTEKPSKPATESWGSQFVEFGGLQHLYNILMSGHLEAKNGAAWTPWQQECLAYLLKLICEFGTIKAEDEEDDVFGETESEESRHVYQRRDGQFRVRYKSTDKEETICIKCLSQHLVSMIKVEPLLDKLLSVSHQSTLQYHTGPHRAIRGGEVVHNAVSLLVSWAYTDVQVSKALMEQKNFKPWLQQLVLLAREPVVRFEACRGLYRLSLIKENSCLIQLMDALLDSLPLAQSLQTKSTRQKRHDPCTREYFSILCRLVDGLPSQDGNKGHEIDLNSLAKLLCKYICSSKENLKESSHHEEEGLSGMLKLCTAVMRHNPPFKFSQEGMIFIGEVFSACLFDLPTDCYDKRVLPLCKLKSARSAAYDLLLEMAKDCNENFCELQKLLMTHHRPGLPQLTTSKKHSYGWHYWPNDNERAPCGLVGIINLGATCYMASCIQQLFLMPQARCSILNAKMTGDSKDDLFLRELQKMFCFLMMSERKAYNPRSFCRTYTMDKQLINTGEQKDMTEFFTDLISKLEEMSPSLRDLVRELFCGVITNNVVSLDCSHVSKTKEEFYSVRCTVADMKNLYESLDEVTVKDTLDGDNMYTCSQCGKKVRAEKRACFTVLPRILCFNTMRYTFNMVTMMKEKVNTHFSFPLQLNMAPYSEEYLMGDKVDEDAEKDPNYWYNLIGVVVHTGTAEGGHYYSFIRNRSYPQQDKWFLFNDAEVKPFDPSQIAGECFGGEMTTKTYDVVSEKFMDLSFEKTHSAYMLFYERCDSSQPAESQEPDVSLSPDLADWIWRDNIQFLHDKHIFDTTYFNFMWFLCSSIPPTLESTQEVFLSNMQLGTSFLLETLVHSKEKLLLKNWSDLLIHHLEQTSDTSQWFLETLSSDDWWLQKLLVKCPVQNIRQMFARLCAHALQALRMFNVKDAEEELTADEDERSLFPFATRFIKAILKLLEYNVTRLHIKNLSEYFWLIHQFALAGEEEREFLLSIDAISFMISFYLGSKAPETAHESAAGDDDDADDDDDEVVPILPEDKYRSSSLEKMISVIALLVEESWDERHLNLSENDMEAVIGADGFPFLFQAIKDAINLRHTTNLVFSLSRYNAKLAESIVSMLITAVQKLPPEQSQSFFKLLSMLTELQGVSPAGMPSFTNLTLSKIWEAAEYNAILCIEWLTCIVPKNSMAHQWVLDNMEQWVEKYLIADNSPRIRNASAYLLVALVPSNHFRQGFRTRSFTTPHKDVQLSEEAREILHTIYNMLLGLLAKVRPYCDRTIQGTTKLVSFFVVMNYCLVSKTEKEMFTPFCVDLWRLFHPLMSEPNIAVHHNKQALLIFWYHVCMDCEVNVAFITDTTQVANNIALNYILSSDEPEVITFNRNVLPAYYGLLRLCCEHSRAFTRQLAAHSNMKWAFENLTTRVKHYPQAIDELFALMRLFSGYGCTDLSSEERIAAANFRKCTILLYLNCLDGVANWTTLITAFKILLQTEQDRLIVLVSQGLLILSDAFSNLHMMYHEATACHVTGDLAEVLQILHDILVCSHTHMENPEVRSSVLGWSEKMDVAQKLLSLLNSYTPKDVRTICLEVLNAMLVQYPNEFVEVLIPMIHLCHRNWHHGSQQVILGPYFPRRHTKVIVSSKSLPRPSVPELNMFLHASYLETPKGVDEVYDKAILDYYQPYQFFADKLIRVAFNQNRVSEAVLSCSCLLAIEGVPLHFTFFSKLWMEVYNSSTEHSKCKECLQQLCQRQEFTEYIELILLDERVCLHIPEIYSFLCCFFPKVYKRVLQNQWKSLLHQLVTTVIADRSLVKNVNEAELSQIAKRMTADLRALALMFSVEPPQKSDVSNMFQPSLDDILAVCRKYQNRKQERLKARQEKKTDDPPEEKQAEDEEPQIKRRRTLDLEEESDASDKPGPSGEGGLDSRGSKEPQEAPRQKLHPLLGPRPPPDWVDLLAKAIQTTLTKLPKS